MAADPAYPPMVLYHRTPRLVLRPWAASDAAAHRALVAERGEGTPTAARSQEIVAAQIAALEQTGIGLLAVELRDGGSGFLGYCGLIVGRSTLEEPEIAYEFFRHAHGHGYATEAATAIVAAAAATGRTRMWATVRSWNAPSFRVLDKLGFARDRVTTDARGDIVWLSRALTPPWPLTQLRQR